MPELPEVETTVRGLNKVLKNQRIMDVWSDYFMRTTHTRTDNIKHEKFFRQFRKEICGKNFVRAERRGKNILIHLSGNRTVLIHMKMTGHLLYGTYAQHRADGKSIWKSTEPLLSDPFNQFIHFVISLSNGKHLAFSDMRKFAKVTLVHTDALDHHPDIRLLGPEANEHRLDWRTLKARLMRRPGSRVKTVLMDQTIVAGIGNIYSDEILWAAGIHPARLVHTLSDTEIRAISKHASLILSRSISVGGDSMSDYRNIYGEKGGFQNAHKTYRRTGKHCLQKGCAGVIERMVIGGRSAHFCPVHQPLSLPGRRKRSTMKT